MKSPIFIFSLPRSGSTLLQRVLMTHPDITSTAEPWILLPLLYNQKKNGVLAEYSHSGSIGALEDFIKNMPDGQDDYNLELRNFIIKLYAKQCKGNEIFFIDKTPRYYLIIPEIVKLFPAAKFIFLFRNPIHILSSMMTTWSNSNFKLLYHFDGDLYRGFSLLTEGYEKIKDKAFALNYENFVSDPEFYIREICEYLDLPFKNSLTNDFVNQNMSGKMGDPTGVKKYNTIETKSLKNWHRPFNTKYRILIAKKYLDTLCGGHLNLQGYSKSKILHELDNIKPKRFISILDLIHVMKWKLIVRYNLNIFFGKNTGKWTKGKLLS